MPPPSAPAPATPAAVLVAALLLSGCAGMAVPGHGVPVLAVPAQWSTPVPAQAAPPVDGTPSAALLPATDPAALAQWWQRFGDPQLSALVAQALQANPGVRSAQVALQQESAQTEVQGAGLLPSVGASESAQRGRSGGGSAGNRFQTGLDASWEQDVFGSPRAALGAGRLRRS